MESETFHFLKWTLRLRTRIVVLTRTVGLLRANGPLLSRSRSIFQKQIRLHGASENQDSPSRIAGRKLCRLLDAEESCSADRKTLVHWTLEKWNWRT